MFDKTTRKLNSEEYVVDSLPECFFDLEQMVVNFEKTTRQIIS